MWKWLLPITLLFLLGLASGIGLSSSGSGMISGTGISSSGTGMVSSGSGISSSGTGSPSSVGLPSGTRNTPWQAGAMEGLEIGFHMAQMSSMAKQGYNISGFNAEVDKYNAWVRQNFGNNSNLMMSEMQESGNGMSKIQETVNGVPKIKETGKGTPKIQGTSDIMPGYFHVPRMTSAKPKHTIDASFNQTTPHSLQASCRMAEYLICPLVLGIPHTARIMGQWDRYSPLLKFSSSFVLNAARFRTMTALVTIESY